MTSYDGNTITYDTIGNPLTDGTWSYTWEQGRHLASMSDGNTTWNYTYDSDGMRISRTSLTDSYSYWYDGDGKLLRMKYNDIVMSFSYGASGQPMSITYDGTVYYYLINAQGDVMGLIDSSGNMVVNYLYDAWGRVIRSAGSMSTTLGRNNPLRYRGYVYDTETSFYYLQSRYYNPEMGRFINADGITNLGADGTPLSYNLFVYCKNNPVMGYDPTGEFGWFTFANAVIGALVGATSKIITNIVSGEDVFDGVLGAAIGGAVYNVVMITSGDLALASAASTAAESLVNEAVSYVTGEKEMTLKNVIGSMATVVADTALNCVPTAATGALSSKVVKINRGWIKLRKLISSFTGKYAKKVWAQTTVQGGMSTAYNSLVNLFS